MPRAPKHPENPPTIRAKRSRRASDSQPAALIPIQVTELEISRRAYQIYESRGGNGGSPLDDWLEAERQLTGR
jgi:hypothetical protein